MSFPFMVLSVPQSKRLMLPVPSESLWSGQTQITEHLVPSRQNGGCVPFLCGITTQLSQVYMGLDRGLNGGKQFPGAV